MADGPKPNPHRIPYREFRARLKAFGIIENKGRGKGSERLFVGPNRITGAELSYPVKCHGEGHEVGVGSIAACLRRFDISTEEFWLYGAPLAEAPSVGAQERPRSFRAGNIIGSLPCPECWLPVRVVADAEDGAPRPPSGIRSHRYNVRCDGCAKDFIFDETDWDLAELA